MRADLKEWMLKTSEELQGLGSKVLLWTNPSPTAVFGAQTVISNTDLTIYDEIEIYYAGNTGYPDCIHVAKQPANTNSYIFGSSNSLTARNVVITDTSLSFGKGVRYAYAGNGSDDNAQLIPQKIYGVIIGATGGGGSGGGTSDYEDLENKPTINGVTLVEALVTEDLNLGDTAHEEVTQAEFNALTPEERDDGTVYFVKDGIIGNVFLDDNTPIGTIAPFGGTSDPSYWLICDGRAVSRTDYAALFGVIGTTYGAGDGSTTFNIPDFTGRIAQGAGTLDGETYTLGDSGGSATNEHQHYQTIGDDGNFAYATQSPTRSRVVVKTRGLISHADKQTSNTREDSTYEETISIMQPYVVTNYIIKYASTVSEHQANIDFYYPVGSYYETSNSSFDPNVTWGGTWVDETDIQIVETGEGNGWSWRHWSDGKYEAWYKRDAISISAINTSLTTLPHAPTSIKTFVYSGTGNGFVGILYHGWIGSGNVVYVSANTNGSYQVWLYVVYEITSGVETRYKWHRTA